MIHYDERDFESLDNPSEPRIRFILSGWPDAVLHQIRLFRPAKARELEKATRSVFHQLDPYLFYNATTIPERTQDFDTLKLVNETVSFIDGTKVWLKTLAIPAQTEMIVRYDSHIALLVQWSVFAASYEYFCYSSLDDICIVSLCERWYLLYFHEDILLFGERSENNKK